MVWQDSGEVVSTVTRMFLVQPHYVLSLHVLLVSAWVFSDFSDLILKSKDMQNEV